MSESTFLTFILISASTFVKEFPNLETTCQSLEGEHLGKFITLTVGMQSRVFNSVKMINIGLLGSQYKNIASIKLHRTSEWVLNLLKPLVLI